MKILLSSRERAAGVFVLVTLAVIVVAVVAAAVHNRWFASRVAYRTVVAQGDGLRGGAPVLLSGVEIGRIGSIRLTDDARIEVELELLAEHAVRLRTGTRVVVRRTLGIGEKRLQLVPPAQPGEPLPPGATLPADEPIDLLDAVTAIDLGRHLQTVDRMVTAIDGLLARLGEPEQRDRVFSAIARLDSTLSRLDRLLADVHEPLVAVARDPSLARAVRGADAVLNDPATRAAIGHVSAALAPGRLDALLARSESLLARLDQLLAEDGAITSAAAGAGRLVNDPRTERLLASLDRMADEEKMARLVDNMSVLAEQMARIGPEIPALSREMLVTMREAVVVLRALQESWLLEGAARKVREGAGTNPAPTPAP